ncbi:hypothetical protein C4546_01720 [Candidatus Parcubacteria bacterium]|jgi:hypothetical protein|nr:MAG: hypothetical protein C4546_01720 [Candidatus Parcubacteria bacterium]
MIGEIETRPFQPDAPETGERTEVHKDETAEKPEVLALTDFALPKLDFDLTPETQTKMEALAAKIKTDFEKTEFQGEHLENLETKPENAANSWKIEQSGNQLFYVDEQGKRQELTLGDLLTDGEWGLKYYFDKRVSKEVKSAYLQAEAKREMQQAYNQALLLQETENPKLDKLTRETYQRILNDLETGQEHFGLQIERAVKNFFKKISINHDFFKVYDADVKQDVQDKIDFIIANVHHLQGLEVQEDPSAKKQIDVQFTTNLAPENIWKKSTQLQKVKARSGDLPANAIKALVKMDGRDFRFFHNRWQAKKTPGGPDRAWRPGTKWTLFQQAMRKFLSSEEIDAYWTMMNNKNRV